MAEESLRQPRASLLECARALGFDGVELSGIDDDPIARVTIAAQQAVGVCVVSVVCHEHDFGAADVTRRGPARERVVRAVKYADRLGAGIVLLPIHVLTTLDDFSMIARLEEDLRYIAQRGEALGVVIGCLVPLAAAETLQFLDTVDSDFVLCYYDVAQAAHAGRDPAAEIRHLGSRICQVRLREEDGRLLGEGRVDLGGCLRALAEIQFPGYLILAPPPTPDPMDALRRDLDAVRRALARVQAVRV
ncbi:MAG: sugar phosphate isomerase/epimerase [Armatimonadetes bacterium]|nr:sugar phosphate isomerase/epimerase [Armatimonadota bacterium]